MNGRITRADYFDARVRYQAARIHYLAAHLRYTAQTVLAAATEARDVTHPAAGLDPETPIRLPQYRGSYRPGPITPSEAIADAERVLGCLDSLAAQQALHPDLELALMFLAPMTDLWPEGTPQ